MYKNGFVKVACITPELNVGNPKFNVDEMLNILKTVKGSFAIFPELCVTGYTCGDLYYQTSLLEEAKNELVRFVKENTFDGIVIVGAPLDVDGSLFNCAFVIKDNKILGVVPKRSIPNTREFSERRYFKSAKNNTLTEIPFNGEIIPFGNLIFRDSLHDIKFGIEICEDMWAPIAPSNFLAYNGCNMVFNLSASNEYLGKAEIRKTTVLETSRRNCGAYIYASAGVNESTSETVFSGHNIIATCGNLLVETEKFSANSDVLYADIDIDHINFNRRNNSNLHDEIGINITYQIIDFNIGDSDSYHFENEIDQTPFVPKNNTKEAFNKISAIQEYALYKRLKHTNAKTLVIGVSGGQDSTLAILVACEAFKKLGKDLKDIIAVTMPGFGTSNRTKNNATLLMENLGVTMLNIPIIDECNKHFEMIGHDSNLRDVTFENTQARVRTMILMNLANKHSGLVLGTGDMSELALGWCTYNGDQMSMYGINAGLPKTLIGFMIRSYAEYKYQNIKDILLDVIDTPISPELSGVDQKTEDAVGKYEVNDFIMHRFLSCGDSYDKIIWLLELAFKLSHEEASLFVERFFKRFYSQQFKRQASPDSPKVLDISLSPRGDFRMPSDIKR